MILLLAAAIAAAAPAAAAAGGRLPRCRDRRGVRLPGGRGDEQRQACRSRRRVRAGRRWRPPKAIRRARGCSPPPAICGLPPASRARPRSRSTGRWPAPACRPSSAARPCSTAPAPPRRRTTSRRPARRSTRRRKTISEDPFLLVFLGRAGDPRGGQGRPPSRRSTGALALAPTDPTILFEAGHVAQFAGDDAKARDYWTRAAAADPNGPVGKAAREALAMLTCRSPSPTGRQRRGRRGPASERSARSRSRSSSRPAPSGTANCRPTSRNRRTLAVARADREIALAGGLDLRRPRRRCRWANCSALRRALRLASAIICGLSVVEPGEGVADVRPAHRRRRRGSARPGGHRLRGPSSRRGSAAGSSG